MSIITRSSNERLIWEFLYSVIGNKYGVAALMGNLYGESGLQSTNMENYYESTLHMTDAQYTAGVDTGSYQKFTSDSVGYGIAQWTFSTRKKKLLDYARSRQTSIGNLTMQLEYLVQELQEPEYISVWRALKSSASVRSTSDIVLIKFENPKDKSDRVKSIRASYGQEYYNEYAKEIPMTTTNNQTEMQLRQSVVKTATALIGLKEADGSFKKIIDTYNSIRPLPVGYKLSYTDAWCAGFVSAVAQMTQLTDIILPECSCDRMINLYKAKGRWQEKDDYVPTIGDIIMYDWQDSGIGDNVGGADHVGIVAEVSGNTITAIEGNISDAVGKRTLQINGKFIRGYCLPDYSSRSSASHNTSSASSTTSVAVTNVSVALPRLSKGSTGHGVRVIQVLLKDQGYYLGVWGVNQDGIDEDYGTDTVNAVKSFQRDHNLSETGIMDANTWKNLLT